MTTTAPTEVVTVADVQVGDALLRVGPAGDPNHTFPFPFVVTAVTHRGAHGTTFRYEHGGFTATPYAADAPVVRFAR